MSFASGLASLFTLDEESYSSYRYDSKNNVLLDDVNNNIQTVGTGYCKLGSGAAVFDGTNSYWLRSAVPDMRGEGIYPTGDFSVQCWFNLNATGVNVHTLVGINTVNPNRCWKIGVLDTNYVQFRVSNDGTNVASVLSPQTMTTGVWHHVVARYHAPTEISSGVFVSGWLRVDVNGTGNTNTTTYNSGIYQNATGYFEIGSEVHGTNHWTNGVIDEVAIWQRYLTNIETNDLYNDGDGLLFSVVEITGT